MVFSKTRSKWNRLWFTISSCTCAVPQKITFIQVICEGTLVSYCSQLLSHMTVNTISVVLTLNKLRGRHFSTPDKKVGNLEIRPEYWVKLVNLHLLLHCDILKVWVRNFSDESKCGRTLWLETSHLDPMTRSPTVVYFFLSGSVGSIPRSVHPLQ